MYVIRYTKYFVLRNLTLSVVMTLDLKEVLWCEPENLYVDELFWAITNRPDRIELIRV